MKISKLCLLIRKYSAASTDWGGTSRHRKLQAHLPALCYMYSCGINLSTYCGPALRACPESVLWGYTLRVYPEGLKWGGTLKGYPEAVPWGRTLRAYPEGVPWGRTLRAYPEGVSWGRTLRAYPEVVPWGIWGCPHSSQVIWVACPNEALQIKCRELALPKEQFWQPTFLIGVDWVTVI